MKNRLEAPPFAERLKWQLDDARRELQAEWLGVAELGLSQVPLAPTWLAASDERDVAEPPSARVFEALGLGAALPLAALEESLPLPLGVPVDDCVVVALEVSPRLTAHPDACLFVSPAACSVDPAFEELRRLLERALSEQRRARLAEVVLSAVEQAADPLELSDREGRLFYVNAAWERFSGYQRAAALGATAGQLFRDPESSPHDPHFFRFAMSELNAGRPWLGVISGRVSDGRRVFAEAHVARFEVSSGGLQGHVAVRRDLADRSRRDLALIEAHREFRSVLSAITDGVCVLRGGLIYFTNAALSRILARPEPELSGRVFTELLHDEDRSHFELTHHTHVSRVRALRTDGSPRFIEISSAGEISFDGHPATILLVRDTTDYHLAQEELSRSEKLSALGAMAAGVAHEINNPLAYVALNLELLRDHGRDSLPPPELEALDEAIEGVSRMREIAHELHTFSGRDEPGPPVSVDLSRALYSALNLVNNEIRQRAQLVRELEPDLYALAREGQLVQVFVNVLVNAAQAIPTPSEREHSIVVRAYATHDGFVQVQVSDTGVGIPERVVPHVFEPFSTSKRRGEGAGLGLAICKRIVDELGGSIRFESVVDRGTTVTITLPESGPASLPAPAPSSASIAPSSPTLRILIVDDELSIVRALERLLIGHEVTRAADGRAALELLRARGDYDVVLCDLMMPGLSGAGLYRQVALHWPSLARRFVVMTGGAVTSDGREFLDAFTGEVLLKPFTPAAVAKCIQSIRRSTAESLRVGASRLEATADQNQTNGQR